MEINAIWRILATGVAGLLFWHSEHVRRRAERLAEEQRALQESEAHFRSLVRNGWDVIVVFNADATVRYASPAVERVLGYPPDQFVGARVYELVHPEDQASGQQLFERAVANPGLNLSVELRLRRADGAYCYVESTVNFLKDDPAVNGVQVTFHDVSERKAFEAELTQLAFHDTLTGLPNRALFMGRLERALAGPVQGGRAVALLFLDLDHLKVVNDSLGHLVGDGLIRSVADRIRGAVQPGDTAARFGGDEFVILLAAVGDEQEAVRAAERIQAALAEPIAVGGHELFTSANVGIALSGAGAAEADSLLRNADLALYRAKSTGRARTELFHRSMNDHAVARFALEHDLRRALERGELRLAYQPIVDLQTGRTTEVEALLRWEHPQWGWVTPAEFIPLAEETGLIAPIGQWVLEEACRQARRWEEADPDGRAPGISVNLSARQCQAPGLVASVGRALRASGLSPAALKLEITESILIQDSVRGMLRELKGLGIRLAMDDFGTGYSSLAYLRHFPIDVLKIDRSFVQSLGQEPADTAIVQAIITLAKSLNLTVTGEGVETLEQVMQLRALGCDCGQGYYFAKPMPGDELGRFLAQVAV